MLNGDDRKNWVALSVAKNFCSGLVCSRLGGKCPGVQKSGGERPEKMSASRCWLRDDVAAILMRERMRRCCQIFPAVCVKAYAPSRLWSRWVSTCVCDIVCVMCSLPVQHAYIPLTVCVCLQSAGRCRSLNRLTACELCPKASGWSWYAVRQAVLVPTSTGTTTDDLSRLPPTTNSSQLHIIPGIAGISSHQATRSTSFASLLCCC